MDNKLKEHQKEYDLIRFTIEHSNTLTNFFQKLSYALKTIFKEPEDTLKIEEIESVINNKPEIVFSYELWHYVNGKKHEICLDPYKKD